MKKTLLRNYARLIVRYGINVQKGQEVLVYAGLDQPEFVQMVVEEAYKAKAKKVIVEWNYTPLQKVHARYQSLTTMSAVEAWEKERQQHMCDVMPARIHLVSDSPDALKGINSEKVAKASQAKYPILKPYNDARNGQQQWCIAAVPGAAWAKKIFPELSKNQAVEKLWEAIITTSRAMEDPLKAWDEHNANLAKRCAYLNDLHIASLHYKAENGTDFTLGLIPEAKFAGGAETTRRGISFNPNIPSEECFTSPMRGKAEGVVHSTKPLSYQGQLINNFTLRFENGHVVEAKAEQGEDLLKKMISMDEGASYLGECALVPQKSPIAESGILFYNTLFDENASCHLALGTGFPDLIENSEALGLEKCHEMGVNESMIHVDFMIGCETMNIDATCADGKVVRIFENGNWAF